MGRCQTWHDFINRSPHAGIPKVGNPGLGVDWGAHRDFLSLSPPLPWQQGPLSSPVSACVSRCSFRGSWGEVGREGREKATVVRKMAIKREWGNTRDKRKDRAQNTSSLKRTHFCRRMELASKQSPSPLPSVRSWRSLNWQESAHAASPSGLATFPVLTTSQIQSFRLQCSCHRFLRKWSQVEKTQYSSALQVQRIYFGREPRAWRWALLVRLQDCVCA